MLTADTSPYPFGSAVSIKERHVESKAIQPPGAVKFERALYIVVRSIAAIP
jgi:hypothetical protein